MVRQGRAGLLLVCVAAALLSTAVWLLAQRGSQPRLHVLLIDAPAVTPSAAVAQIAGAVANPGVYPIIPGERLDALVAAAGGMTAAADADRVNLARRIADGERIDIPTRALTPQPAPLRVRVNHAGRDELLSLPGVTISQAAAIQSSVRRQGPIGSANELVQRHLATAAQAALIDPLADWSP